MFLNFFHHPESRNSTNIPMSHEEITGWARAEWPGSFGAQEGLWSAESPWRVAWEEQGLMAHSWKSWKALTRERMSLYNLLSTYHSIKWGWIKKENKSGMIIAQLVLQQCSPEMFGTGTPAFHKGQNIKFIHRIPGRGMEHMPILTGF